MTKYDYIFHPDTNANGEWTVQGMDLENECVTHKYGPVIVLTIEELEQVFAAGAIYGAARYHPEWEVRPDFKTYLTSKGIST